MFRNYFKLAFRNFQKQKAFSLINIVGLSVGLTSCLLVLLWVQDERSYNQFHTDADRIYQQKNIVSFGNNTNKQVWGGTPYPYYEIYRDEIPEVEEAIIMADYQTMVFKKDQLLTKESGAYSDPSLFKAFSFPFIDGQAEVDPNTVVLSEKLAKKYFKANWEKSIGNSIIINDKDFLITGIFENVPDNSTIQFDYVLPLEIMRKRDERMPTNFGDYNYNIFFKLAPNASTAMVKEKLYDRVKAKIEGTDYGTPEGIVFQPISKIHLYSKLEGDELSGGRIEYVRIFTMASLFLLLLACVNYMNLSTARSSLRAKEVGVRKTVGASRNELMGQFFVESFLMSLIGVVISLLLLTLLLPEFNGLLGKNISLDYSSTSFWLLIGSILLGTTFIAGSYPALMLSSFSIQNVLKGKVGNALKGVQVRKGLVVFQFLISSLLLISALTVRSQIHFIKNKNLGLDKNNVIYQTTQNELRDKYDIAKERLKQHPAIKGVSGADASPLRIGNSTGDPTWKGFTEDKRAIFRRMVADYDFLDLMKIPIVEGRNFDNTRGRDSVSIIVNERAVKQMEMEDPIGQAVNFWGDDWIIVGVVKDFHLGTMHSAIDPLIIVPHDQELNYLFIRPEEGQTEEAIAAMQEVQKAVAPNVPFKHDFLDAQFESMYEREQTTSSLADLFAIIALFVSTLGLLGLAAFAAERRTKEIGIRKVLGASVMNIITLLSKDFIQLILIAFLIAIPIAWYFSSQWLEGFAYHINVQWWIFALTIFIAFMLTMIIVGLQGVRAAVKNPIDSLRSE